ncbi:recombinase family protein [Nonomuraea sp. NPDC050790]|uniref:recombinase family protein n=1 Tax=Nonomuraea sp. NPDC050790 TaxID=3364371 RepID=UPI0037A402A9
MLPLYGGVNNRGCDKLRRINGAARPAGRSCWHETAEREGVSRMGTARHTQLPASHGLGADSDASGRQTTRFPEGLQTALSATQSPEPSPPHPHPHAGLSWALYARAGGDDSRSIERQHAMLQNYVGQLDGHAAAAFADVGQPGPALAELVRQAEEGVFGGVMAWNLRRFGWQHAEVTSRLAPLRTRGIVILLAESGQEVTQERLALTLGVVEAASRHRPAGGPKPRRPHALSSDAL